MSWHAGDANKDPKIEGDPYKVGLSGSVEPPCVRSDAPAPLSSPPASASLAPAPPLPCGPSLCRSCSSFINAPRALCGPSLCRNPSRLLPLPQTLFVGRLSYEVTESKLRREFEQYGPIKRIRLVHDTNTDKPRGYAFLEFNSQRDMKSARRRHAAELTQPPVSPISRFFLLPQRRSPPEA